MARPKAVYEGARWDKWVYAGLLTVFALLSLTALADPNAAIEIVGGVAAAFLFTLAIRATQWGQIELYADHVAVRSLWRTRRFRWRDVQRFVVEERPVVGSPLPALHRTLGVHLVSGRTVWLRPADASARHSDPTWVDQAADALNECLSAAQVSD